MAKAPMITPEVEALVLAVHYRNPTWTAEGVCNWVRGELHNPGSIYFFPRWPEYPDSPSLSKVQKVLATGKQNASKLEALPEALKQDKLWCMGTLHDFPIPTEALSAVAAVWMFRLAKGEGFTIREAKWVSILAGLERSFPTHSVLNPKKEELDKVRGLSEMAGMYAEKELMYDLAGHPFNSTSLDKLNMGIPLEAEIVLTGKKQQQTSTRKGVILEIPEEAMGKYQLLDQFLTERWDDYKKEVKQAESRTGELKKVVEKFIERQNEGKHKEEKQK